MRLFLITAFLSLSLAANSSSSDFATEQEKLASYFRDFKDSIAQDEPIPQFSDYYTFSSFNLDKNRSGFYLIFEAPPKVINRDPVKYFYFTKDHGETNLTKGEIEFPRFALIQTILHENEISSLPRFQEDKEPLTFFFAERANVIQRRRGEQDFEIFRYSSTSNPVNTAVWSVVELVDESLKHAGKTPATVDCEKAME
jgi:hypothetical protein